MFDLQYVTRKSAAQWPSILHNFQQKRASGVVVTSLKRAT
uniref:Uncharacterized protein n=1 Tax=Utricularia reniformis TaxID=192314 RepID=A0A1Y0B4K5_9LAMI|nr:hypothetical protein AEK19_MT2240 [Utricularia reniformis]ART32385.1 hypothetical protein AEK19_MT2240 [Utricularia reniformis]